MKTIPVGLAILTCGVLFASSAQAKRKVDLSGFDGRYKGTGSLVAGGVEFYPLSSTVKFKVGRNGQSAKVNISGLVFAGSSVPWGTEIQLTRNGRQTTSNIVALYFSNYPGRGKYKQKSPSKITGSASLFVEGNVAKQTTTFSVRPKGRRKKQLKLSLVVTANGSPLYVYKVTATGK
mgnify:CR=1 FL=1